MTEMTITGMDPFFKFSLCRWHDCIRFLEKLLVLYIFIIPFPISAQERDSTRTITEEGFIELMDDKINLKLAITNSIEIFSVHTNFSDTRLSPNTANRLRIYFDYQMISFFFSYSPEFFPGNDDDSIRGETSTGGIGFGLTFRKWFTDLGYSRTRGYFLENTEDYIPGWKPGDPYIQYPELVTRSFEGALGISLNSKYSRAAATSQTSRQLKSAGTMIPRMTFRFYIIDDESGVGITQQSHNFQLTLGAGYHYTFVHKEKLYINCGFTPAIGFIHTKLKSREPFGDVISRRARPVFQWDGRLGLGYNGPRFYAGGYISAASVSYRENKIIAATYNAKATYQLFAGYRFNAPKFLRSTYDKVYDYIL